MKKYSFHIKDIFAERLKGYLNSSSYKPSPMLGARSSKIEGFRQMHIGHNRISVDKNSGLCLDSAYLSNFDVKSKESIKRKVKSIIVKVLSTKFPQFESYLKKYSLLWDNCPYAIHSKTIKERYKVIHYERILAYNYFNKVSPYIDKKVRENNLRSLNFIEVGPGVGNLAMVTMLHANQCPKKYFLVDLPEALPFSISHLMYQLPELDFVLPHEYESFCEKKSHDKDTLVFLTSEQIGLLPDRYFDFAVNTNSFAEMHPAIIKKYFQLFRRCLKEENVFFTVNRVEKCMDSSTFSSINAIDASKRFYQGGKNVFINRFYEYPWSAKDHIYEYYMSRLNMVRTTNNFWVKIIKMAKDS